MKIKLTLARIPNSVFSQLDCFLLGVGQSFFYDYDYFGAMAENNTTKKQPKIKPFEWNTASSFLGIHHHFGDAGCK